MPTSLRAAVRRPFAALATAAVLAAATLAAPAPAPVVDATGDLAPVAARTSFNSLHEHRVINQINRKRTARGLKPVRALGCPDRPATKWAQFLAANDAWYHQKLDPILNLCNATYAGEVLARGNISPKRTVRLWMQSPPHRRVILSKYPTRIGVGTGVSSSGELFTSAVLIRP